LIGQFHLESVLDIKLRTFRVIYLLYENRLSMMRSGYQLGAKVVSDGSLT
jgi:hypothetical protein